MSAKVRRRMPLTAPVHEQFTLFAALDAATSPPPTNDDEVILEDGGAEAAGEGRGAGPPDPIAQPAASEPVACSNPLVSVGSEIASPLTLADVLDQLTGEARNSHREAAMRSAVRTVGRVLDRPLTEIPADPAALRPLLAAASPMKAGIRLSNWKSVKSAVRAALRECGTEVMPGRDTAGHSTQWRELASGLPDRSSRHGLSRLLSFFSRDGLGPADVKGDDLERFCAALLNSSLHSSPEATYRQTVRLWNRAVEEAPGWPQVLLEEPGEPRRRSAALSAYPAAFQDDVEAFLAYGGNQDPFSEGYGRSVRPATTKGRRKIIMQLAGALADSGFNRVQLTSLDVLTRPENATRALKVSLDRKGGSTTPHIAQQATLLRTIAKHWVKDPDRAEKLKVIASNLRVKRKGMAPRNRERLRQFDLDANVDLLLGLPRRVFDEVRRKDNGHRRHALRVMNALALELLFMAPIRLKNLTDLEARHFVEIRRGAHRTTHLVIPAAETKTDVLPYEAALPSEACTLLQAYLQKYRGRLCAVETKYLFPNPRGERRNDTAFSRDLSEFIGRETSLEMNTHLFRHLAAKLYLAAKPQGIEVVRQLLGHTTTKVTLKAYAELSSVHAIGNYDATILARREEAARGGLRRRRKP